MWVRPDGLQSRARRNAWSAMVSDSRRRQSRIAAAQEAAGTGITEGLRSAKVASAR
jgi:hypothetical protein